VHTPSVRARRLAAEGRIEEFVAGLEALHGVRIEPAAADAAGPTTVTDADESAG